MKRLPFVLNKRAIEKYSSKSNSIVVIASVAAMLLFSCQAKVAKDLPPGLLENSQVPAVEAVDLDVAFTDSGIVRYHLATPKMLDFSNDKNPYRDFPEGFALSKFDENGATLTKLTGNRGKNFINEDKWIANGNVVMVNNAGDTLRTEELIFLEKEDMVYSNQFVSIKKGDQYITGQGGFKSDTQMSKWEFIKTKGHIYVTNE